MAKRKRLTPAQPGYLVRAACARPRPNPMPGAGRPGAGPDRPGRRRGLGPCGAGGTQPVRCRRARAEGRLIELLPLDDDR